MKKLFLSMAMVAAGAAAYAQIGQGALMLGGSLGLNATGEQTNKVAAGGVSTETKTPSYFEWNLSPRVGYFVTDNLAVGVDLSFGQSYVGTATSANGNETENYNSFNLGLGVFGRYYANISDNFYFYGEARVGYASGSHTVRVADPNNPSGFTDGAEVSSSQFGIAVTPGLTYFPSPKWGVDFNLGQGLNFTSYSSKSEAPSGGPTSESSRADFGLGINITPTIGLHYYMGK